MTRFGWPNLSHVLPSGWFTDKWYVKHGERLPGSTGSVYHVHSRPISGRSADMLVKFSRVAQEVPLVVQTTFPEDVPPDVIAAARFNSPMEEFGLLMEMRHSRLRPSGACIRTQHPLAIYAPPEEFQLWQLGRDETRFIRHRHLLAKDQADEVKAIELDIRRVYVLLYGWIKGEDAAQSCISGAIDESELRELTLRASHELRQTGFRVLDHKPQHFILRRDHRSGNVLRRRNGQLEYALVDYELLERTSENQQTYKTRQRERFRQLRRTLHAARSSTAHAQLKLTSIHGIDYVRGPVQDGGCLWVTGQVPDLFEYFVPDRWRRTPRVRLSRFNEVYRTRTRDNIYFVYRRSRVGTAPHSDPFTDTGKRIREHGYNSPFEEVAIAEQLRILGISTTVPLAIYRTGHRSHVARYLQDRRRFPDQSRAALTTDACEPYLIPNYDYYTIWEFFRGVHPDAHRDSERGIDLDHACERRAITEQDRQCILDQASEVLSQHGIQDEHLEGFEFTIHFDDHGTVLRDANGDVDATVGIDGLTAFEIGLLDEDTYREIIRGLEARLRAADCEKLDLKGSHVLLSMDTKGQFKCNRDSEPIATLCNFEFIRGLYRPLQ